jgi:hypothetical protein
MRIWTRRTLPTPGDRPTRELRDGSLLNTSGTAELLLGTATYTRVPGSNLLSSTVFNNGSSDVLTVYRSYDSLNRLTAIVSTPCAMPHALFPTSTMTATSAPAAPSPMAPTGSIGTMPSGK